MSLYNNSTPISTDDENNGESINNKNSMTENGTIDVIENIINPNNIWISEQRINHILKKFGVNQKINNLKLFHTAFIHKSYQINDDFKNSLEELDPNKKEEIQNYILPQELSYERLEYIGDAILNAVIAHYVFRRYPDQPEGFLTTLRTKLVRSNTLAQLSKKLKFQRFILLSNYVENKCNGRHNPKILEDVFESFVGALFLNFEPTDQGFTICQKYIVNVFENFIDISSLIHKEDNFKKILLEYYQKTFHTEPKYQTISMQGSVNRRVYTMGALSPSGEIIGIGRAKKKVDAEQIASKKALQYLETGLVDDSDSETDDSDDDSSESSTFEEDDV